MATAELVAPAGLPAAGKVGAAKPPATSATPSPAQAPASSSSNRRSSSTRTSSSWSKALSKVKPVLPRKPDAGDLAGFCAGLVGYAIGLSYIRYGTDGPKGWISAKFINKPLTPTAQAGPSTPSASSSNYLVGTIPGAGYATNTEA